MAWESIPDPGAAIPGNTPEWMLKGPMAGMGALIAGLGPAALIMGGGALLGAATGKWAEDQAWKENKKFVQKLDKYSVSGLAVGKELEGSLDAQKPIPSMAPPVRESYRNATLTAGARGGMSTTGEARAALQGIEGLKSAVARMDSVRSDIERVRTSAAARATTQLAGARAETARGSAEFSAKVASDQVADAQAAGDAWRDAVAGMTKIASLAYGVS